MTWKNDPRLFDGVQLLDVSFYLIHDQPRPFFPLIGPFVRRALLDLILLYVDPFLTPWTLFIFLFEVWAH